MLRLFSSEKRVRSRFRNMLWYTVSSLIRARSWNTVSMPSDRAWSTDFSVISWPSRMIRPAVGG